MKHNFLENTIVTKFIKALLYNTYLPIYKTASNGDYIIKDMYYVIKKDIIKCTTSGYVGKDAIYYKVKSYEFGLPYPKYTDNFIASNDYYDSDTHERLGDYLRCYRDINQINLMPFYNCFNGSYTSGLKISSTGIVTKVNSRDKIFKVPIQFNKTYTIAIDSFSDVWLAPAVINNNGFVTVQSKESEDFVTKNLTEILCAKNNAVVHYNSVSFKHPITYKLDNTAAENEFFLQQYEKDLYLMIQVSSTNTSSLVVLEGDYTKLNVDKVTNTEYFSKMTPERMNELFLSELSMLYLNDNVSYPFSDRLLEYLLQNVIDSNDTIGKNIRDVQEVFEDFDFMYGYPDVWTDELREDVYQAFKADKRYKHIDNTGFVDKDVEKFILRRRAGM